MGVVAGPRHPIESGRGLESTVMSAIAVVLLSVTSLVLLIAGFLVQARNRSPYSGTSVSPAAMKRIKAGAFLGALGILLIVAMQLVRLWR
jgi:hypothetical protein